LKVYVDIWLERNYQDCHPIGCDLNPGLFAYLTSAYHSTVTLNEKPGLLRFSNHDTSVIISHFCLNIALSVLATSESIMKGISFHRVIMVRLDMLFSFHWLFIIDQRKLCFSIYRSFNDTDCKVWNFVVWSGCLGHVVSRQFSMTCLLKIGTFCLLFWAKITWYAFMILRFVIHYPDVLRKV
jgi:hypothetical protein